MRAPIRLIERVLPAMREASFGRLGELYGSLEAAEEQASMQIPAGRLGTVDEYAAMVVFLCSASASYVTGTAVLVDGGLTQGI